MQKLIVAALAALLLAAPASAQIRPPVPVPPRQGQPSTPPEIRPGVICRADLAITNIILRKLARPGDLDVFATLKNVGSSLWSASPGQVWVNISVRNASTGAVVVRRVPLDLASLHPRHGVVLISGPIESAVGVGPLYGSVRASIGYSADLTAEPGGCANDSNTANNAQNVSTTQMRAFVNSADTEIVITPPS